MKCYCVTCGCGVEPGDLAHRYHQILEERELPSKVFCVTCKREIAPGDPAHRYHQVIEQHPNALRVAAPPKAPAPGVRSGAAPMDEHSLRAASQVERQRYISKLAGWDRCLGGGLVRGTTVLLSGDPGVGKSSLTLTVLYEYAKRGIKTMYVTGEESRGEVEIRYAAMGLEVTPNLILYATKSWESARAAVDQYKPSIVLLDSANRLSMASVRAPEGSDIMVAAIVSRAIDMVQTCPWQPSAILIGHINAQGKIRGEKGKEHDVTATLHLSFDAGNLRLLRSKKNRHGGSGEISVWQFRGKRYVEVHDLSETLLSQSIGQIGVVAFPVLPSRTFARAVTVPVEVAVSPPREANEPRRRSVAGLPPEVFEESLDLLYDHAGVGLTNRSVRAKAPAVGGAKIDDEACALALCLALLSGAERLQLPPVAAFGALAPTGRVQIDPQVEQRLDALRSTSVRLAIGPELPEGAKVPEGITYEAVHDLADLATIARRLGTFVPEDPDVIARKEAARRKRGAAATDG